jgi:tetratricopeptide (TPR) repeat protein
MSRQIRQRRGMTKKENTSDDNLERRAALHALHTANNFIRMRSWQNAVIWLNQAIKIQPDFFEAYCLLGEAYLEIGEVDQAIKVFDRAIQLRPDNVTPHLKLGLAYITIHNWNAALGQFHTLRSLDQVAAKELFDKLVFSFNYQLFDSLFN